MKKHWILLRTFLVVALSLASLQGNHGIDRPADEATSLGVALAPATPQVAPAIEPAEASVHPLIDLRHNRFPKVIGLLMLKYAAMELCREFNHANKLANVSKGWLAFIKSERADATTEYAFHFSEGILREYTPKTFEQCCQLQVFLNSKFVFFMEKQARRIEFPVASFPNPFRVSLDLFEYLDPHHLGLIVGTGSREGVENVGQQQYAACVNVIPFFWIKKELENGRAAYLRNIYMNEDGSWKPNALIGLYIIRQCDNLEDFACVTTECCRSFSSESLGKLFFNRDTSQWKYNKNVATFGCRGGYFDGLLRNGVCSDVGNLYFHL